MSRIETCFRREALAALAFVCVLTMAVSLFSPPARAQQPAAKQSTDEMPPPDGKAFASPEAASAALFGAAKRNDEDAMLVILGPGAKDVILYDTPEARKERHQQYAEKYEQMHRLVTEPDGTVCLYVGAENWPVPFPIVHYKGAWYFNAELGMKEVMFRRIGRNEVEALEVCHALVDAEKDYFAAEHNYTAKFVSTSGTHDGLYWKGGSGKSPIGPYLAHAGASGPGTETREPYHGYYYRIVMEQGSGANANFAVVAFPAEYRTSGVMTFLMNQNGEAYEKDLGPATTAAAQKVTSFNPDSTWKKTE